MTTATASPTAHFNADLAAARAEAIAVLRAAMRPPADDTPPPTREARLAACAVLRLRAPDLDDAQLPSTAAPPRAPQPSPATPPRSTRTPTPRPQHETPADSHAVINPDLATLLDSLTASDLAAPSPAPLTRVSTLITAAGRAAPGTSAPLISRDGSPPLARPHVSHPIQDRPCRSPSSRSP